MNAESKLAGVELTEAQIDQIQAQVLEILQRAMGMVSQQVAAAAQTLDDSLPEGGEQGESAPVATPDAGAAPVDQVPA